MTKRTLWTDSATARNVFEGMDSVVENEAARIWSAGDEALSEEEKLLVIPYEKGVSYECVKTAGNRNSVKWAIVVRRLSQGCTITNS